MRSEPAMGDDGSLRQLTLPDGRKMSYAEYGSPAAYPVIYCHGFPGSRYEAQLLLPAIKALDVRVIAPDRPGYGGSDPLAGRSLMGFADDVRVLCDHLDLAHCAVLGVSGGGPYALSLLFAYPERVTRAALVAALGPASAIGACRDGFVPLVRSVWDLVQRYPFTAPLLASSLVRALRLRARFGGSVRFAAPADWEVLSDPAIRAILTRAQREGLRLGGRGAVQDLVLYLQPWGFALSDVHVPITIWHGLADRVVPAAMAVRLGDALPQARIRLLEGEGHYSLPIRYGQSILESVMP
ncbi:MAG: alpha/beta fold hydrolase [Acidiferrobacter sp.]